jgi:hypothetical protein
MRLLLEGKYSKILFENSTSAKKKTITSKTKRVDIFIESMAMCNLRDKIRSKKKKETDPHRF